MVSPTIKKSKPLVAYISSAITPEEDSKEGFDFFAYILARLVHKFTESDYDGIVKIPPSNDNNGIIFQQRYLKDIIKRIDQFEAVIISPLDLSILIGSVPKESMNKVITIDKGFKKEEYSEEYLEFQRFWADEEIPPFAISDGFLGGELAAVFLHQFLIKKKDAETWKIGIMRGLKGSPRRVEGFRSRLTILNQKHRNISSQTNIDYVEWDGMFRRGEAELQMKRWWKNDSKLHAVFCCNDEMALGVRKFFLSISEDLPKDEIPVIVGYDKIREVEDLIKGNDLYIKATIDVRIEEQIDAVLNYLEKYQNQNNLTKADKFKLLVPKIYPWSKFT